MKIRAIVTGATGMVGEGVLNECLLHPDVSEVLIINRKPSGFTHPKLKEFVHANFFDFSSIESQLTNYDACFFCLGVSSVGMKENEYRHLTYDLTMHVAETLRKQNPSLTFCYISGKSTDSTEKGRMMWARVKGKTENDLINLYRGKAFMFRPGYMHPTKGLKNTLKGYKYISWMYPVLRLLFKNSVTTLAELGLAMIKSVTKGYSKKIIEVPDIVELAKA